MVDVAVLILVASATVATPFLIRWADTGYRRHLGRTCSYTIPGAVAYTVEVDPIKGRARWTASIDDSKITLRARRPEPMSSSHTEVDLFHRAIGGRRRADYPTSHGTSSTGDASFDRAFDLSGDEAQLVALFPSATRTRLTA